MSKFYVRIGYYDQESDIEEYGTVDEASEGYCTAIDMQRDRVLGDVSRISYGKYQVDGKMKSIDGRNYE